MSKYNHYLIEIAEPTSSNETLRVRVMMENGHSVYFGGDHAELLLDILKGNCPMMTDDAIRTVLREKDEKIKVMQEQIEDLDKCVDVYRDQIREQGKTIGKQATEKQELEGKIKELTDVRDYLRKENNRLTGETTKFSNMIQERNKEIDILSRQFTNHTNTIIDQNNAINGLKKKNAELIKTIKALEDESAEYRINLEKRQDKYDVLVGERDFLRGKIKAMEKTNEKGLDGEWLRKELNKYCEENEKLRKKNDELADRNFDLAEELEKKQNTIDILEKSFAEQMEEKNKEINKLKNSNEVLRKEVVDRVCPHILFKKNQLRNHFAMTKKSCVDTVEAIEFFENFLKSLD